MPTTPAPDPLLGQATTEVNAEVAGATAPIQGQVDTTTANEQGALKSLGDLFTGLMPFVQAGAASVADAEKNAAVVQKGIFDNASLQLNQMKQARAQEAQALAQRMGGPVDMGEFERAMAPTLSVMPETFAASQLHALAQGSVSVNEAQDFASKVFPLYDVEQTKQMTSFFENKKADLKNQIAALEAQKPGLINTRLNELQQQERQNALDQADLALRKLQAAHDWTATKAQLAQQAATLKVTMAQLGLDVAGVTGLYQGKPTLAAKAQAASIAAAKQASNLNAQQLIVKEKQTAMGLAESITSSGAPYTYTSSTKIRVPEPLPGAKGVYPLIDAKGNIQKDSSGNIEYYTIVTTKQTTAAAPRTSDPDVVYTYLLANGISPSTALETVRANLGNTTWKPGTTGKATPQKLTTANLNTLTTADLQAAAKRMGYKNPPAKRALLIQWIVSNSMAFGSGTPSG